MRFAVLKRDKPSVYPYDRVDKQVGKAGYIVGASKFGYAMEGLSRVQSRNVQDQTFFPSMSANWVFKTGLHPQPPCDHMHVMPYSHNELQALRIMRALPGMCLIVQLVMQISG